MEKATKKQVYIKPEDAKEAAKATLHILAGAKSPAIKEPAQTRPGTEIMQSAKSEPVKPESKTEPAKPAPEVKAKQDTAKPEAESKKEADPGKEFIDGIMTEMALKGASKKRLIKMLAEKFDFDKQKVMFRLKRALISERYAAAHAEAGH